MLVEYYFPYFYRQTEMRMIGSHNGILAFVTIGLLCLNKLVAAQSMLSLTGVVCPPCTDVKPPGTYTCSQQRDFGKCNAVWMMNTSKVAEGFCETTCGRCRCPGSPRLPPPKLPQFLPSDDCICTDKIPPGTTLSCEQQRAYGKCFSVWMLDTSVRKEGYCQITCNRCPCNQKPPEKTETPGPRMMPVSLPGLGGPILNGNSTTLQSPPESQVSGPVSFDSPELINGLPSGARAIILRNPNGPPVVLIEPEPEPEPSIPAVPPKQPEPKKPSSPKSRITRLPSPTPEPPKGTVPLPVAPVPVIPVVTAPEVVGQPTVITSPPATVQPLIPSRPQNETVAPEPVEPVSSPKPPAVGQPAVITSPPVTVQPLIPPRPPGELGLPVVPVIFVDLEDFPLLPEGNLSPAAEPAEEPDAEDGVGIVLGIDPTEEPALEPIFEPPITDSIGEYIDEDQGMEPMFEPPIPDAGVVDLDEGPVLEPSDELEGLFLMPPLEEPVGEPDVDELLVGVPSVEPLDEMLVDFNFDLEEGMQMEPAPEPAEDLIDIFVQGEELFDEPLVEPLDEYIDEGLDELFRVPAEEPFDEADELDKDLRDVLQPIDETFLEVPAPDDEDPIDDLEEIMDGPFGDFLGPESDIETVLDLTELAGREPDGELEPPDQEPAEEVLDIDYLDDLEEGLLGELERNKAYHPAEEPATEPAEDMDDDDLVEIEPPVEEPQKIDFPETPMVEPTEKNIDGDLEEFAEPPTEEPTEELPEEPIPESDIQVPDVQRVRPVRRLPENCTATADMLASNPDLTMLTRLMTVGGLLGRSGGLLFQGTLFAPNDEAITAALKVLGISFDELLDLSEILQGLLSFLLVDEILFEEDLINGMEVNPRLEGVDPLVILRSDFRMEGKMESIIVVVGSRDTARIVDSGMLSCDVAIHVIDEFLLPSLETAVDSPGVPGLGGGGGGGGGVDSDEEDSPNIEGFVTTLEDVLDTEDMINNKRIVANVKLPTAENQREAGLDGFAYRTEVDR
ncbi:hypothetical protein BSKO_00319 [Bryopsis sp. KO-2023]|nr:hypothetical protein BSKO_00319 [Bryopsis sp. KO-2023]